MSSGYLEAECTVCGGSIITAGRDESSRAAIATFKREHAAKHMAESVFGEVPPAAGIHLHFRPAFGKPTMCGLGFLAHAVTDWERVTCPSCIAINNAVIS